MELKNLLNKNNFKFNSNLGQNFLSDEELLSSVVEGSKADGKIVIEIGPGAGTLTREICKRAKRVIAFEVDKSLEPILKENLQEFNNYEIRFKDFMKVNLNELENELNEEYMVIANIPYYITSPILIKLLKESKKCSRIVLTIQKEVALRFTAKEGTKDYGCITTAIYARGDSNLMMFIPKEKFYPMPKVDSACISIDIYNKYPNLDMDKFDKITKAAFLMRRKTLINNFIKNLGLSKEEVLEIFSKVGIDENARGEELSTDKFVELTKIM